MQQQKIIILDFGSQTTQLIARRLRELDTFCEILPYNKFPADDPDVIGVILSGSPYSVHDPEAFKVDLSQFVGRLPVLGICYGAQFISHSLGGRVEKADSREYGRAHLETVDTSNPLFHGFDQNSQVWMSHGDTITAIPEGFEVIGSTKDVTNAAFWSGEGGRIWGVQFHPEVSVRRNADGSPDAAALMEYETARAFFEAIIEAGQEYEEEREADDAA
jgi:GMP synthase (glutamine-hydrolysing)